MGAVAKAVATVIDGAIQRFNRLMERIGFVPISEVDDAKEQAREARHRMRDTANDNVQMGRDIADLEAQRDSLSFALSQTPVVHLPKLERLHAKFDELLASGVLHVD